MVAGSALVPAGDTPGCIVCSNYSITILKLTASGKLELSWSDRPFCGDMNLTLDSGLELFACVFHCESVCDSLNSVPGLAGYESVTPGDQLDVPVGTDPAVSEF